MRSASGILRGQQTVMMRALKPILLATVASLAWGTSSEARATTTGGEDETTGTGDTTTSSDTAWDDDGGCGTCTSSSTPVEITSPKDGATVGTPFTVAVRTSHTCSCDTCGCWMDNPWSVSLMANGTMVASCNRDCSQPLQFEIELPAGEHDLRAIAAYAFSEEWSEVVHVTVVGAASDDGGPATDGASTQGTGTSGGETNGSGHVDTTLDDDGCGCRSGGVPAVGWMVFLMLALRRRHALVNPSRTAGTTERSPR
jgi:MYXO-CTERM domain-containing protein